MNPSADFSLESALAQWRADLQARTALDRETIAELETHLREAVLAAVDRGEKPAEAFAEAVAKLGAAGELEREFQRVPSGWVRWSAARFTRARMRKIARDFVVAVAVALVIRQFIAIPMYAASNGLAPEVPQGSHFLVSRLPVEYRAGDVVVYHHADDKYLGRVVEAGEHDLKLSRTGTPVETVSRQRVIGRVVAGTR